MLETASLAILVVILISAISIGIGYATSLKTLYHFGREEFFNAIVSAAILGSFATILSTLSLFGITCSETCNVKIVSSQMYSTISHAVSISYAIGYIERLSVNIGEVITYSPFSGLSVVISTIAFHLQFISFCSSIISFLSVFIITWSQGIIDILLTCGVLFRVFYPLRALGNFLIGLAFGIALGFLPSIDYVASLVQTAAQAKIEEISAIRDNLSWLPLVYFGEEGSIEKLATESKEILDNAEKSVLYLSALSGDFFMVSIVGFAISSVIAVFVAYGFYKLLSIIRITQ